MNYVVTRHLGALEWLTDKIQGCFFHLDHLHSVDFLFPGDVVVGTLPINVVAEINARGANYYHLSIELPYELRGQELSAEQLKQLNAQLVKYFASRGMKSNGTKRYVKEI